MIEVIYKEETIEDEGIIGFSVPKNIRQIGLIHEKYRIYVEDYVYSFLEKLASVKEKNDRDARMAVLTGQVCWKDGVTYFFIQGAILAEEEDISAEHICFSEYLWDKILKEQQEYFENQDIIGWFLTQPGIRMCETDILNRAHVKYFGGEKLLLLMEVDEGEEAFFCYENNTLMKQPGYYIYYEKNIRMQNYMITKQEQLNLLEKEKNDDEAVQTFRKIIQDKSHEEEKNSLLSYAAAACLVLTIGTVGVRFYQSYDLFRKTDVANTAHSTEISEIEIAPTALPVAAPAETSTDRKTDLEKENNPAGKEEKQVLYVNTEKKEEEAVKKNNLSAEKNKEKNKEKFASTKETDTKNERSKNAETEDWLKTEATPIPASSISLKKSVSYVVRPGDSVFQISLDHYGSIDMIAKICEMNGFSEEDVIYPGQIIVLP